MLFPIGIEAHYLAKLCWRSSCIPSRVLADFYWFGGTAPLNFLSHDIAFRVTVIATVAYNAFCSPKGKFAVRSHPVNSNLDDLERYHNGCFSYLSSQHTLMQS